LTGSKIYFNGKDLDIFYDYITIINWRHYCWQSRTENWL